MRCRYCGQRIPEGELYCRHCGKEVRIVPDYNPLQVWQEIIQETEADR